ncbi:hypothetical protein [Calothrix sp. CCY 0018]
MIYRIKKTSNFLSSIELQTIIKEQLALNKELGLVEEDTQVVDTIE